MKKDVGTFLQSVGKLPSLPSIYYELNRAVENPSSSVSSIGEVIQQDQSLTSRLLRLANSALYSFPSKIGTIEEALQLIGLREVQDLALATCVIGAFPKLPAHLVDVFSFWRHSIGCAIASSLLAKEQHDPAPERFFVGGLLHDIGRLILFLKAPDESRQILSTCETQAELASKIELEVMGFDHAILGGELISLWKLPISLREMVRYHHNPSRSQIALDDVSIIHHADFITSALDFGPHGEPFVAPLLPPADSNRCILEDHRVEGLVSELDQKCALIFPILTQGDHD